MIFLYFIKVCACVCVCVCCINVLQYILVTDEHLVTGDSSSIDNMLVEENGVDSSGNTSNPLKYACSVNTYICDTDNTQIVVSRVHNTYH